MSSAPLDRHADRSPFAILLFAAAIAAAVIPSMLAWNLPPSATFFNQATALIAWGAVAACIGALAWQTVASPPRRGLLTWNTGLYSLVAVLGVLMLEAACSSLLGSLPGSLSLSSMGMLAAALVLVAAGAVARAQGFGEAVFKAVCIAFVVAGLMSVVVSCIQLFLPSHTDSVFIARSEPGRAAGNLRQPNHLASFLVWSLVAAIWLHEVKALTRAATICVVALFIFTITMSGSRTGALELVAVTLWGVFDKRLSRTARTLLVLAPLFYAVSWVGLQEWAAAQQQFFLGMQRQHQPDVTSSRFAIWSNTIELIKAQPWWGVGFGEFNLAWTLTPFAHRPVEFFDHTHNLELQLAGELGLPVAVLITALLIHALWRSWMPGRATGSEETQPAGYAGAARAGFVMLFTIGIHSQLEYPLWYAYFLLPTALLFGLNLGPTHASAAPDAATQASSRLQHVQRTRQAMAAREEARRATWPAAASVLAAGTLVAVLGIGSILDYMRVVAIFAPPLDAAPLMDRIIRGEQSPLFSHHADYAEATTEQDPPPGLTPFAGAVHYLLDARLMIAWADAYARAGDFDRARYIAARLREFHNSDAALYFGACQPEAGSASGEGSRANPPAAQGRLSQRFPAREPYQCEAPSRALTWRDFVQAR